MIRGESGVKKIQTTFFCVCVFVVTEGKGLWQFLIILGELQLNLELYSGERAPISHLIT